MHDQTKQAPKVRATLASLHTLPVTVANAISYVVTQLPELDDPDADVSGSEAVSVLAEVYPMFKDALNTYPTSERQGQLSAPWAPPEVLTMLDALIHASEDQELTSRAKLLMARYRPTPTDQEPSCLPGERVASALAAAGITEQEARDVLLDTTDSPSVVVLVEGGMVQESASNVSGIRVLVLDADTEGQEGLPIWCETSHDPALVGDVVKRFEDHLKPTTTGSGNTPRLG